MPYAFNHQGTIFTPAGKIDMSPTDAEARNAALEAAELDSWRTAPDAFHGYVGGSSLTTWRGVVLGAIVRRSRHVNNLGARIESITVRGTNGATYHGRYGCDWSQFVRLRKSRT